jgi:hypothetical protein
LGGIIYFLGEHGFVSTTKGCFGISKPKFLATPDKDLGGMIFDWSLDRPKPI